MSALNQKNLIIWGKENSYKLAWESVESQVLQFLYGKAMFFYYDNVSDLLFGWMVPENLPK